MKKKIQGYPQHGSRVSRQSPRVRGWLKPENSFNSLSYHFGYDMKIKLTKHVRNTKKLHPPIFLNKKKKQKKKTGEISIF